MGEIKRIGPPTPINGRGSEYDLSVPLNATPSQLWRRAFQAPDYWKEPFHPSRITIKHRALLFTSEDCRVQLWMALIDKWIASANERGRVTVDARPPGSSSDAVGNDSTGRGDQCADLMAAVEDRSPPHCQGARGVPRPSPHRRCTLLTPRSLTRHPS
jgi:hypothetical protein